MYLYKCGTDDVFNNPWLPGNLVEGWTSLIWTERYTEAGEFQLKTPEVKETLALIPDGSLLCINESREVMRVESHSISTNDDGVEELTVSGRSYVTFLEERQVKADVGIPYPMLQNYKVQDAIGVLLYAKLDSAGSLVDKTGGPEPQDGNEDIAVRISIRDHIILQKAISGATPPDITDLQSTQEWYLENGDAYKFVLDWLRLGELGLRTLRPPNDLVHTVSVNDTGVISDVVGNTENMTLVFDLYNGRNRSITPSAVDPLDPVIFRYDAGHLERPNYLFSRKGYKNYCRVVSSDGQVYVWDGDDGRGWPTNTAPVAAPIGTARYELSLDLGTLDAAVVDPVAYMRQAGKTELKKRKRQVLVDGAISVNAPYEFGTDYYLGDYVTVMAEYDVMETMQVNEFVRSQDKDGYKAYPTLIRQDLSA